MTHLTRLALWLHEHSLAANERDAIVGDLVEDIDRLAGASGARAAERWIWMQTIRSLLPNVYRRLFTPQVTLAADVIGDRATTRGARMFNGVLTDIRFATRLFKRQPLTTVVALLSLTVGLGLNILLFTIADAALLRPLALRDPGQLVLLLLQRDGRLNHNLSYPDYQELRDRTKTLDGLVAYSGVEATVAGSDGAMAADGEVVSGNFFATLGVPMMAGRALGLSDDTRAAQPVAVISEQLWRDRLASAPLSDQSVIVLNRQPFTVVGVAAAKFAGMQIGRRARFWIPTAQVRLVTGEDFVDRPTMSWLTLVGRVRSGVGVEAARQELDGILRQRRSAANQAMEPVVLQPGARGDSMISESLLSPMTALSIAGVLVLLVACVNVANLQLARTEARRSELAVRAALGARRGRLVRLVLVDGLLMALTAGAAGVWLALVIKDRAASLIAFYGEPIALCRTVRWSNGWRGIGDVPACRCAHQQHLRVAEPARQRRRTRGPTRCDDAATDGAAIARGRTGGAVDGVVDRWCVARPNAGSLASDRSRIRCTQHRRSAPVSRDGPVVDGCGADVLRCGDSSGQGDAWRH